ncbi:Tryprostatin B 6-hydroxylase [Elsinoe australis]|uniref:Tryprostatin B 6-hydroxylase n=1 Tax=Elsinoe australis TaxID=40998 RepID=A0A2P8AIG1_9PEZI|nr:Tryprostatin B 6-hydroxylase [Elsinoe australis]
MANTSAASSRLPLLYRLFFLYIEPVATAVGAYYAHFGQKDYLAMTVPSLSPTLLGPSKVESIVLTQLANMYFVFALNEALVLRATTSREVWRTFLLGLLIADFGHLYSVNTMGLPTYWRFWEWNAIYWGNLGFVYVGALLRTCFLLDVGFASSATTKKRF